VVNCVDEVTSGVEFSGTDDAASDGVTATPKDVGDRINNPFGGWTVQGCPRARCRCWHRSRSN